MAAPVITSSSDATAKEGVAFTYIITATNIPTSFNATPLPPWLAVNTGNGHITGTPLSTGDQAPITISATNADGTGTATLSIRVEVASGIISLNDRKSGWFAAKGFVSNDLNTQISSYLAANGGGNSKSLNTQWYAFLSGKGRTGSIMDMYRAELIASLASASSKESITDLETRFYGDTNNVFA